MLLPQRVSDMLGNIVKADPEIAVRRASKVFAPNLLVLFRKIWLNAVRVYRVYA
jgi:hypothetical protein